MFPPELTPVDPVAFLPPFARASVNIFSAMASAAVPGRFGGVLKFEKVLVKGTKRPG